jgi:hypothetical protein
MTFSYEILLLLLVLVTAAGAIMVKDLLSSVLLLGSYSFFPGIGMGMARSCGCRLRGSRRRSRIGYCSISINSIRH